jgi:ABC-2 type transport system ATP-binding protein
MCSHLLAEIEDVCDRVAILYNGELKLLGTVDELLQSQGETQFRTTSVPPEAVKEVEAVLARHGARLEGVSHPKRTLEDLFLDTVSASAARPGQRFLSGAAPGPGGDGAGAREAAVATTSPVDKA